MKNYASWFPHEASSHEKHKLDLLIHQLGPEGYGLFWLLLEVLRKQPDFKYPTKLIPSLARKFNTSTQKLSSVITGYDLFEIDELNMFFSPEQILYLQPYLKKSMHASHAAKTRWSRVKQLPKECASNANALHGQCASNASKVK
ncbi:MAG: DUF4373 domain-containing protein [Candidatus Moranbacteria bacterium]|nr:DUF4373 domain-containing protein [Candidatus Moranbacteria bacterium]